MTQQIRTCSFCGRKYAVEAALQAAMNKTPWAFAVHDECTQLWLKLTPQARLARIAEEQDSAGLRSLPG